MIKHLVMWRLHDEAENNNKATNTRLAKEKLEALIGQIPGLIKLEVGCDFSKGDMSCDLALYSELESLDALTNYQQFPEHVEAAQFLGKISKERRVVDYEI